MYTIKNILSKSLVPVLVLLFSLVSCTKGNEPIPVSSSESNHSTSINSSARLVNVVGGDDNEDDDDDDKKDSDGRLYSRGN